MNSSGKSVIEFFNYFKFELDDLIVVYDDIDIQPGEIRVKKSGSPGTHNGMKSVVNILKTDNFKRVRVGIGKPHNDKDLIEHVIGGIEPEDIELLNKGVSTAKEAVLEIVKNNVDIAMNKYN